MGYGDDINLVLPVEEYDEVRKSSQHDATGSMQIDGINVADRPPHRKSRPVDCLETCALQRCFARRTRLSPGWPRGGLLRESVNPSRAYNCPQIRLNLGQRIGYRCPGLDFLNTAGNLRVQAAAISASPASSPSASALSHSELASRIRWSSGNSRAICWTSSKVCPIRRL